MKTNKSGTAYLHFPAKDTPKHVEPRIRCYMLSRARRRAWQPKRVWKHKAHGFARTELLALLLVVAVMLLISSGVGA